MHIKSAFYYQVMSLKTCCHPIDDELYPKLFSSPAGGTQSATSVAKCLLGSGNEFKNLEKIKKMREEKIGHSFRPLSGNEFKNKLSKRNTLCSEKTVFVPFRGMIKTSYQNEIRYAQKKLFSSPFGE